ncbi:unnamed protein product [Musa acuminata subsp. malaccensis]|nr:unnamed protein product [Musa acuminata subsp. malaccensis]
MIQKRTMRKAGVLCPLPPAEGDYKPEAVPSQASGMTTVELLVKMHCGACAEQAEDETTQDASYLLAAGTDLSAGKVTVTGTMNGEKLVEYIRRRTGKAASIVPQPPKEEQKEEAEKKPEETPAEGKKEEKQKEEKKEEVKSPQPQDSAGSNKDGDAFLGDYTMMMSSYVRRGRQAIARHMCVLCTISYLRFRVCLPKYILSPIYVIQQPPPPPPQLCSDENPNNARCISRNPPCTYVCL